MYGLTRFHLLVLSTWQIIVFFGTQNLFAIFANYTPRFKCGDDGTLTRSCRLYKSCNSSQVVYEASSFQSAALEFDWVCNDSSYMMTLFTQFQFLGILIGTLLFAPISDMFGRKPLAVFTLSMSVAACFCSGLATTPKMLIGLRFLLGAGIGGMKVSLATLTMELILPQQRMVMRGFFNWGWARVLLTLVCFVFSEWRTACFASAIIAVPALIMVISVFPESPTWLRSKIIQGRLDEMREVEKYIARVSNVAYVPVHHNLQAKSKGICGALVTKGTLRRLVVLCLMWFVAAVCSYANDLHSSQLSGNLFVNQSILGFLVAISKIVLLTVDTKFEAFNRRMLHQGAQLVVCICFFILTVLTINGRNGIVVLVVNILGSVFIEYTWDACQLCAVESVETSCRSSAAGTCSLAARVGTIIAPLLNYANHWWAPSVFATVTTLGAINLVISYAFLIETKNVDLDAVVVEDDEKSTVDEKKLALLS